MTVPDKKEIEKSVKRLFKVMFTSAEGAGNFEREPDYDKVREQISAILDGLVHDHSGVAGLFTIALGETRKTLLKDARFILASDPAARDLTEVIIIYPGFFAIFCYRIAHLLHGLSVPFVPRIITEYAHLKTGIDIHPGAVIGSPVSIDHGTGIVIGETTRIGNNVKLYQGVTLGALSVDKSKSSVKRHPTIEDDVILYAGCTILGGDTVIGRNSIIGGNVWLTESIEPYSVVYHKSEIIVRSQSDYDEPVNWVI